MPVSKKRRPKKAKSPATTRSRRPHGLPGYVPQDLPDEVDGVVERLLKMGPEALPTLGLAEWYLASSPVRMSNQCVVASLVIRLAMRRLGLDAEPVALQLDVPDGRGGTTRYGSPTPHMDKNGLIVGHVGLVCDGYFVDPTATQFPEVRRGGSRAVGGSMGGEQDGFLREGGMLQVRLLDGTPATYRLGPLGSADPVLLPLLDQPGAEQDIARMAKNLLLGYTKALSQEPFLDRVRGLTDPRYALLVDRAEHMVHTDIAHDAEGWLVAHPTR